MVDLAAQESRTPTQIIVDNIYSIAKEKQFFIYELENDMGVSRGYFSRFKGKNPYLHEISMDKVVWAANELEVPLRRLLKGLL